MSIPTPNIDKKENTKVEITDPIAKILAPTDFVAEESLAGNLDNIPEYLVLKALKEKGELSEEGIVNETNHPLVAVAVRNLLNAEMVEETTNGYKLSSKIQL